LSEVNGIEDLRGLAGDLGRPIRTLLALTDCNDPFYAGRGSRQAAAEWFAGVWRRVGLSPGVHLRRIHYVLISRPDTPPLPNGRPYRNTEDCWDRLGDAARDARYLGLVPFDAITDHGSDGASIHLVEAARDAALAVAEPDLLDADLPLRLLDTELPAAPTYDFTPAGVDQHYHVELWAEKTTINDVLARLGRQYGVNTVAGVGDMSATKCFEVVQRIRASGRPARILYISDFDPQGFTMPVSVARKIEFIARDLDLDIQVRPVVLTHDQCVEYRLPRTPIKDSANGKGRFEERFGEGATELDALEALHPGLLEQILEEEILRYYDDDLDDEVERAAEDFRAELDDAEESVASDHEEALGAIRAEYDRLAEELNAEIAALRERYGARFAEIAERFNAHQNTIAEALRDAAPDVDQIDWPEPREGDEDDDPLFDSTRDYVEQIDRYKEHQDKPTEGLL
jgi:hypothetical protein